MTPAGATAPLLRSPFARVLLVGVLVLLLQVPAALVGGAIQEREASRTVAAEEVGATWGARQDVSGPFLVVPYRIRQPNKKGEIVTVDSGHVVLLPEHLEIDAGTETQTLHRGLFEIPVYRSKVRLAGRFAAPQPALEALVPREALRWHEAQLALRLADVHAIEEAAPLRWAGRAHDFEGGGGLLRASGLHAPLPGLAPAAPADFSIELALRGSEGLFFAPAARDTRVALRSDWPHPKFRGSWLPEHREVTADGFTARWRVTSVARGLPPAWKNDTIATEQLDATRFGVDLLQPVDPYRMSERSLKYSVLFIGLTFMVMWLFEVLGNRALHAVQYLLLGSALCLFYLLELSLAEHLGFGAAYAIAAAAVTAQVALYARAILRGRAALVLLAVVASLYGLLYALLRAEDYALLLGAGALFAVLSAVMFLTRRVQWLPLRAQPGQS